MSRVYWVEISHENALRLSNTLSRVYRVEISHENALRRMVFAAKGHQSFTAPSTCMTIASSTV